MFLALGVANLYDKTVVVRCGMIGSEQEVLPRGSLFDFGLVCSWPEGGVCVVGVMHSAHLFFLAIHLGIHPRKIAATMTLDVRRTP
jgi:hypothetical protein